MIKTVLFSQKFFSFHDHHQTGDIKRKRRPDNTLESTGSQNRITCDSHKRWLVYFVPTFSWTRYPLGQLGTSTFSQVTSCLEILSSWSFTVKIQLGFQCLDRGSALQEAHISPPRSYQSPCPPVSPRPSREYMPFFKFLRCGEQPHVPCTSLVQRDVD